MNEFNIWKEPRKFGRFWDKDKTYCTYGVLIRENNGEYLRANEYDKYQEYQQIWYQNFEEITDLKEILWQQY